MAHNSCILNDFNKKDNSNRYDYRISAMLGRCCVSEVRKLSNNRIRQIAYTLFIFNDIVTSKGIKNYFTRELNFSSLFIIFKGEKTDIVFSYWIEDLFTTIMLLLLYMSKQYVGLSCKCFLNIV